MKLRLLDILACPIDKTWPLNVHIFDEKKRDSAQLPSQDEVTKLVCRFYCGKNKKILSKETKEKNSLIITEEAKGIKYTTECKECLKREIIAGIIECPKCHMHYPIVEEIPMMLRPELRNEEVENEFINTWAEKIKEIPQKKKE